jgi:acid stress chaperone HdeB
MKNFWIFPATIAAMSFIPHPAAAVDRIDLNTVKCGEWIESGKENIGVTIAWLDGYYKEDDDPPIVDFEKMHASAAKLGKFCAENKDLGLGTAAEKILGKK